VTEKLPRISSLNPIVLPDQRRVMFDMVVENLPSSFSSITLTMPDMAAPGSTPSSSPQADVPSPYPDVELSILDSQRRPVVTTYIIEHKEAHISLTLHLRHPDIVEQYTARAELTYQQKTLQVVEVPFSLKQSS
jgi:hypothetical protein